MEIDPSRLFRVVSRAAFAFMFAQSFGALGEANRSSQRA
jgi:hypothetical protein